MVCFAYCLFCHQWTNSHLSSSAISLICCLALMATRKIYLNFIKNGQIKPIIILSLLFYKLYIYSCLILLWEEVLCLQMFCVYLIYLRFMTIQCGIIKYIYVFYIVMKSSVVLLKGQ
jgi:hypothetical protein